MGNNCLKISRAQNDEEKYYEMVKAIRRIRKANESISETKELEEEEVGRSSESVGGVVRIKVLMSQEELKQILSCHEGKELKYPFVEKILENAMKLQRGSGNTRFSHQVRASCEEDFTTTGNWRPVLESIPEETM
ncbi:hypothetical protein Dsin_031653 [Dipteronia sinensis]|uniref:Uncharacterized protein n=1 Tax=Dipteronia sinensis TaxID=43782 RepID=A0AAE0DSL7_9ROSI|nr:hypothetical protein Dsin_031653 [Dipteronia sinensis]